MNKEKEARRNKFDPGFAQGIAYNISPIPGAPENTGKGQNNMTGNPGNRADNFSQPSLDGTVNGLYDDRKGLDKETASQLGAVVNNIPRSSAQQGYDSVSTRGLNQLPLSQTPVTPDEKGFAYLEANRLNGMGSPLATQVPEFLSPMGGVGVQAPMPGSSDPEATPAQNALGFTFDPSQSIASGTTKTTIPKNTKKGNA